MHKRLIAILLLVMLLSLLVASVVFAQTGSGFDLHKNVIAAGGGKMSGSGYTLTGTLGQTAVGPTFAGAYRANQGFWYWLQAMRVMLPLVLRS